MSRNPITRLLRFLFFAVVVRAVILVALGLTGAIARDCRATGLRCSPAITIPISMRSR